MARRSMATGSRTPTGRKVTDYMGRPPRAVGTGPKNLAKSASAATSQVRGGRPKASRAANPRVRPSRASAGYGNPPAGAASGVAKATTPMAKAPSKRINKPKTGRPANSRRVSKPRADGPSRI